MNEEDLSRLLASCPEAAEALARIQALKGDSAAPISSVRRNNDTSSAGVAQPSGPNTGATSPALFAAPGSPTIFSGTGADAVIRDEDSVDTYEFVKSEEPLRCGETIRFENSCQHKDFLQAQVVAISPDSDTPLVLTSGDVLPRTYQVKRIRVLDSGGDFVSHNGKYRTIEEFRLEEGGTTTRRDVNAVHATQAGNWMKQKKGEIMKEADYFFGSGNNMLGTGSAPPGRNSRMLSLTNEEVNAYDSEYEEDQRQLQKKRAEWDAATARVQAKIDAPHERPLSSDDEDSFDNPGRPRAKSTQPSMPSPVLDLQLDVGEDGLDMPLDVAHPSGPVVTAGATLSEDGLVEAMEGLSPTKTRLIGSRVRADNTPSGIDRLSKSSKRSVGGTAGNTDLLHTDLEIPGPPLLGRVSAAASAAASAPPVLGQVSAAASVDPVTVKHETWGLCEQDGCCDHDNRLHPGQSIFLPPDMTFDHALFSGSPKSPIVVEVCLLDVLNSSFAKFID